MMKLRTSLISLGWLLFLLPAPAAAQTYVGYVLEVEGDWHLNNDLSRTLRGGQKLPASGAISVSSPSRDDRIVIADMRGQLIASRNCAADDCANYFTLPRGAPPRAAARELFGMVMELIWGSPGRYSAHRKRGTQLPDVVARLEGRTLDLSRLLPEEGEYLLRWREVPAPGAAAGAWSEPVKVTAGGDGPPRVSSDGFKPGLYEFRLLRDIGGGVEPIGGSGFVLAVPPEEFDRAAASLREAAALTSLWGERVMPETVALFLRAHLDGLARQRAGRAR